MAIVCVFEWVPGAVEDGVGDDGCGCGCGGSLGVVECAIWTTGSSLASYTASCSGVWK